jgi:hypothetical protein
MVMVFSDLAEEIKSALGFDSEPTSAETLGLAQSFTDELQQNGLVSHALVVGTCPPGGPITNAAAQNGLILGVTPATLLTRLITNMKKPGPTPQLQAFAAGFATAITSSLVDIQPGNVIGVCANSPVSPGPFVGSATMGTIIKLDSSSLANLWAAPQGGDVSKELQNMADVVVKYIMDNAEISYLPGTITGVAPPGGGPLAGGVGVGGKIF